MGVLETVRLLSPSRSGPKSNRDEPSLRGSRLAFPSLLLALLLSCTALASCSSGEAVPAEIVIGVSGPMTGDLSDWGVVTANAAVLAARQVNDAGGPGALHLLVWTDHF